MPPKSKARAKATPKKIPEAVTPDVETPVTNAKKRKVDWTTIDDKKIFQGFQLEAVKIKPPKKSSPAHKKQKTGKSTDGTESWKDAPMGADIVQKNPFPEGELSETHYKVKPSLEWESTQRYRKFTISDAEFEVGQVILVKIVEDGYDRKNPSHNAFGLVLEVRAGDASHVFLRVYWLYKPEELPEGRQPYHGDSELIASNHMDIIEALTVEDREDVVHWAEDPDHSDWPLQGQFFWRQTFDIEKPKAQQLSKLRPFCIDKAPCNPDEPLVNCPWCLGWLHARCLEEQAVDDACKEQKVPARGRPAKGKKKGAQTSSNGPTFTASLTTSDSGQVCVTVTDRRPGEDNNRWNVDITCLLCKTLIEKAARDIPLDTPTEVAKDTTAGANGVAITSTVSLTPEADEEDSVFGKDDDTDSRNEPVTSDTAASDPEPKDGPIVRGRPRKRKRRASRTSSEEATPAVAASMSESVFQSSIRSVRRLLWRTA